jgi:uncharacterized protein involved in exopolysaccharide biosynthesis
VSRYLETFLRHKIALMLPIIIALTMSTWYATSVPHKYETDMTVWFDTAAPSQSSLEDPSPYTTPAAQGQIVLQEFFGTEQFLINVAHRGPLADFLANYHPAKKGPSSLISTVKSLFGKSSSSSAPVNSQIVDSEITSLLGKAFTVSVLGPQIVRITMIAPDPSYMPATLNAVAAEYIDEVTSSLKTRDAASVAYYETQVNAAKLSLSAANSAVVAYQQAHPGALPTTDPDYNKLTQVAFQAQTNFTSLQNTLQEANLTLQNVQAPAAFHVVDPALAAIELSNKKHMLFTVIAGLLAGFVITVLALSALVALDKTARREEDIEGLLGMEVVAIIRELPSQRRLPAAVRRVKSS